jgi:hypothetical protein
MPISKSSSSARARTSQQGRYGHEFPLVATDVVDNGQVPAEERNVEFTMREWEQAWIHTRHLESMRGQYLGFFFTAVLGVTAFAGPRLADGSLRTPASLLTVAMLALGLQLASGFIYLAIVRLNEVMGRNEWGFPARAPNWPYRLCVCACWNVRAIG